MFYKIFILLLCLSSSNAFAAKHVPTFSTAGFIENDPEVRQASNFNIGWRFIKGDVDGAFSKKFNDKDWKLVNLPHGIEILPLCASGSINYQGPSWYRKYFTLDESFRDKKIFVHFEGIMGISKIWINGKLVNTHYGGYFPVHLDISEYIDIEKENTIAVYADNSNNSLYPPGKPQELLDFTYFGGMYRDVWLIKLNKTYITHPLGVDKIAGGGVFSVTERIENNQAFLKVLVDIENEDIKKQLTIRTSLTDKNNFLAAEYIIEEEVNALSSQSFDFTIKVDNPLLWSPNNPHLYNLCIEISDDKGKKIDSYVKKIGIRTIELKGRKGLFLNGEKYPELLLGGNRHQDFAHIGNALPNNLHWRDALKLRQIGMKVIRSAHYAQDPAFLDACDALGLFVVNAIPGWQFWNDDPIFSERMLSDVRKIIRLERNRPSSLIWEIIPNETHFPDEYAIKATSYAHEEFPFNGFYTATDGRSHRSSAQEYFDVLYADDTMWKYRDKSVFKREWGDYVDNWIDHNSVSRVAKQWGEIPQLHQAYHYFDEEWLEDDKIITWPSLTKIFSASPALVGATLWHPFDHQRGYHPDPFWGGIMDAYRQPKFSYYLFKSLSSVDESNNITNVEHEPFVYIAHLMTPFSPNNVTIFTNCEEVKLTSFGKHYGIQKAYDDLSPVPRVPVVFTNAFNYDDARNKNKKEYGKINQKRNVNSQIIAEGLIDNKVVATHTRWPVGRKNKIILKVDDTNIQPVADGSDITPVVAYLVDNENGIKRLSDEYIRFTVLGEGELINGINTEINPQKLLWGEAVALIRSTTTSGEVVVRAETIKNSINSPQSAELTFKTLPSSQSFIFSEQPEFIYDKNSEVGISDNAINNDIDNYRNELMNVGKQQQDFIQ